MSTTRPDRSRGVAIIAAIFLVVILAALGGYMVSVSSSQQRGHGLDLTGSRVLQAANAGLEWAVYQVAQDSAGTVYCNTSSDHTLAAGRFTGLDDFTVRVECIMQPYTEGTTTFNAYRIAATACNAAACPPAVLSETYVERRLSATVTR